MALPEGQYNFNSYGPNSKPDRGSPAIEPATSPDFNDDVKYGTAGEGSREDTNKAVQG